MNASQLLIAFATIASKEARRFVRIWGQTLIPPVITMLLYFFIFGSLIGSRIGNMDGFSYITYIVPGLVMMSTITNSFTNVVSSFFSSKFHGSIQEILVSPTPPVILILGYCSGGVIRGTAVGILVTAVSYFFTNLPIAHPFLVLAVFLVTAFAFSLAGLINGIFARKFDDVSVITTFVLTPLTYLGGVFYSVDLLAEPWKTLSFCNPVLYMVNAFRYGFLGTSDVNVALSIVLLSTFCVALFFVAHWMLKKGIGLRS